jgi:hypothetical protein
MAPREAYVLLVRCNSLLRATCHRCSWACRNLFRTTLRVYSQDQLPVGFICPGASLRVFPYPSTRSYIRPWENTSLVCPCSPCSASVHGIVSHTPISKRIDVALYSGNEIEGVRNCSGRNAVWPFGGTVSPVTFYVGAGVSGFAPTLLLAADSRGQTNWSGSRWPTHLSRPTGPGRSSSGGYSSGLCG